MAAQSSFILADEELSCPICFEDFSFDDVRRRPKLLLCLHTFCSGCMETLRKYDGTLLCSICRTSHIVHRVNDLLENYVIFDHLRLKQESEDETLAMQLRDEYDIALRRLEEQEERDAVVAKEEAEKIRIEIERREKENEELKRLEEERVRQDDARRRLEEERIKKEEQERLIMEENERKQNECEDTRLISDVEDVSDDIYSCTNTSDSDGESSEESNGSSDNEEDSPFHDVEEAQTEDEEAMIHIRSYSSLNSEDDYVTIGNDSDHHSSGTVSVSSGDEEEMGTAVSGTAPISSEVTINLAESSSDSITSEPDILSDEFSGVAQSTISKRPKTESLSDLLPSVKCFHERADGSIVILDKHVGKSECSGSSIPNSSQQIQTSNTKHLSDPIDYTTVDGSDDKEWVDIDTSEDEALPHCSRSYRSVKNSNATYGCKPQCATKISNFENENCKIQ